VEAAMMRSASDLDGLRLTGAGLLLVLQCVGCARAGIAYLPEDNRILVTDFPETAPCTPTRLWKADRAHGWGRVTYDPGTDATTVAADLWIGDNDGAHTYFQVGGPSHPREILRVRGNVIVRPDWIQGQDRKLRWWYVGEHDRRVNRLTIGLPGNPAVTPAVEIDATTAEKRSLRVGWSQRTCHGGELHVYNARITAATPDRDHMLGTVVMNGRRVVLKRATISWVAGVMTSGAGPRWRGECVIEDCVFEHGGIGIGNGEQRHLRSVFRDLEIGVRDYGCLDAVLTECVFENNACNWSLGYSGKGLTCIDCTWTPPAKANSYRSWLNKKTNRRQYPSFTSRRHVIVEVVDDSGRPVADARVEAVCEGSTAAYLIDHATLKTNAAGLTPGRGESGALLLTERIARATDVVDKPAVSEYVYRIAAEAPGCLPGHIEDCRPVESWQTIRITLERRADPQGQAEPRKE